MTQLLVFPVLLITLLLGTPACTAYSQKGLDAFQRGDYETALREWRPLAEQGNARAQTALGLMYAEGQGVSQDYETAVKWYRLAAEQGFASAQNNLRDLEKQIARERVAREEREQVRKEPKKVAGDFQKG